MEENDNIIYHICEQESWLIQESNNYYVHASIASEGFIHASQSHQVEGVLDRYFDGMSDLVKLSIDESKLSEKLVYEEATNGEAFPHIYGPIHKSAIVKVEKIR